MTPFWVALQFLTIIPVSRPVTTTASQLGESVTFYPIIGLLIGGGLVGFTLILDNHLSSPLLASILLISWVILTGGLHLDGLADCADAWVGGFGHRQRSLEIMKDPAAGPIAVICLVLILLLKWNLILVALENQHFEVLILTPMLGRLAILISMLSSTYIRKTGLAAKIILNLPRLKLIITILVGTILTAYFINIWVVIVIFATIWLINTQANKRLGGVTGDVYGATVELVEVNVLLGGLF